MDAAFERRTGAENPLDGLDVGERSKPAFVDLNADGRLDLVSGAWDGTFHVFFQAADGAFERRTGAENPLDGLDVGDVSRAPRDARRPAHPLFGRITRRGLGDIGPGDALDRHP